MWETVCTSAFQNIQEIWLRGSVATRLCRALLRFVCLALTCVADADRRVTCPSVPASPWFARQVACRLLYLFIPCTGAVPTAGCCAAGVCRNIIGCCSAATDVRVVTSFHNTGTVLVVHQFLSLHVVCIGVLHIYFVYTHTHTRVCVFSVLGPYSSCVLHVCCELDVFYYILRI